MKSQWLCDVRAFPKLLSIWSECICWFIWFAGADYGCLFKQKASPSKKLLQTIREIELNAKLATPHNAPLLWFSIYAVLCRKLKPWHASTMCGPSGCRFVTTDNKCLYHSNNSIVSEVVSQVAETSLSSSASDTATTIQQPATTKQVTNQEQQ